MKTLLLGINAKYIHPNLAILLLANNTTYETETKEFTIKEKLETIVDFIILNNYDCVGISCYIWNIEMVLKLIPLIKQINNKIVIILGGPEVSYNGDKYIGLADYVIKNEGEEAFHLLLSYLHGKISINDVPNLYHSSGFTFDKRPDIEKINTSYHLLKDVKNQIIYFETSRGCPFHCAYCMASLDNKVRYFPMDKIKNDLKMLLDGGAKVIKFLDRTFNSNKKKFLDLVDFLILNHKPHNSFQFEITGDLLDKDVIEYINNKAIPNLFRFEIGIQSTNLESNRLVYRIQNNEKLFENIRLIQEANIIDLHLDLIAGLPHEDYKSFNKTFNDVVSLRPKELQLGFLKLLHGTKLEEEAYKYKYVFHKEAPYEIIENDSMSQEDIKNIHYCEEAFEKYYNYGYINQTIQFVLDNISDPFTFFHDLGVYIENKAYNRLDLLLLLFDDYLKSINFPLYDEAHIKLIIDYLNYNNVKAKAFWDKPSNKNEILRYVDSIGLTPFSIDILYKYAIAIEYKDTYIIALYLDNKAYVYRTKKISNR